MEKNLSSSFNGMICTEMFFVVTSIRFSLKILEFINFYNVYYTEFHRVSTSSRGLTIRLVT